MGGGNGQQPRGPKLLPPPLHPPHRVSKFRQRWVLSVGLISSIPAHPQFPGDTCKIPSVGWGGKWAQVALTRQLLWRKAGTFLQRFSTPKPPWPAPSRASPHLPLPCSSQPPSNQAVGSSSGSWGSPPPSRAFRFFDISARAGALGCSFPTPSLPPSTTSERRVKVGLAGGEGAGKRAGGTLPEEGRHFGGAGRLPEAGTWRAGGH